MGKDSVTTKLSKEFQVKLKQSLGEYYEQARDTLLDVLKCVETSGRYRFKVQSEGESWKRRGERFDTLPNIGLFRQNGISLATEKRKDDKAGTKLKCKLHNLVPELLYSKPETSWGWPRDDVVGVERKFKLEQDIHFDNAKFCATGYLVLPGTDWKFKQVGDFTRYFPLLSDLPGVRQDQRLYKVKDWDEYVQDEMVFEICGEKVEGALVTRRNRLDNSWDETEFSFKVKQKDKECGWLQPARGWDEDCLRTLSAIYKEMYRMSSVFIQSPSIFYFHDPVASKDIIPASGGRRQS
jgi:hypothetical protein